MKNILSKLSVCLIASTMPILAIANISPADLMKVDSTIKQNCVEYYTLNGQMYCSTKALNKQPIDPEIKNSEVQTIIFDDRPWQAVWGKTTNTETIIEYVPMGDDIDNWNELVTSQFFAGLQNRTTAKQFGDAVIQGIKDAGFNPIVTDIKNDKNTYMFEFRIESPPTQIQDEIQKITVGKNGLHALHYAIKKADMGKKNRELWIRNLSKSNPK